MFNKSLKIKKKNVWCSLTLITCTISWMIAVRCAQSVLGSCFHLFWIKFYLFFWNLLCCARWEHHIPFCHVTLQSACFPSVHSSTSDEWWRYSLCSEIVPVRSFRQWSDMRSVADMWLMLLCEHLTFSRKHVINLSSGSLCYHINHLRPRPSLSIHVPPFQINVISLMCQTVTWLRVEAQQRPETFSISFSQPPQHSFPLFPFPAHIHLSQIPLLVFHD